MSPTTDAARSTPPLTAEELTVFVDVICRFFDRALAGQMILQEPRLEFAGTPTYLDYTGFIDLRGRGGGTIYLTMSTAMTTAMLRMFGEQDTSAETLRGAVGEIAGIVTTNAREYFGGNLEIGEPQPLDQDQAAGVPVAPTRFVLPIAWHDLEARFVIALAEEARAGSTAR